MFAGDVQRALPYQFLDSMGLLGGSSANSLLDDFYLNMKDIMASRNYQSWSFEKSNGNRRSQLASCTPKVGPPYLPTMIYLFHLFWNPEGSNAGDKYTSKYMAKAKIFISAIISSFYAM